MIYFSCSKCGEQLEAPLDMFSEILQCPKCGSLEQVPELTSRDLHKCFKCDSFSKILWNKNKEFYKCPSCGHKNKSPNIKIQKAKKITGNAVVRIWKNSPASFRTAFLTTMGILAALFLSLFVYGRLFLNIPTNEFEKTKSLLAKNSLFFTEKSFGIFRGRYLDNAYFLPDVNYPEDRLVLWLDDQNNIVGVSIYWNGSANSMPAEVEGDPSSYDRANDIRKAFEAITGYEIYFNESETFFDSSSNRSIFQAAHKKWKLQIEQYNSYKTGTNIHKEFYPNDFCIYYYVATAQSW